MNNCYSSMENVSRYENNHWNPLNEEEIFNTVESFNTEHKIIPQRARKKEEEIKIQIVWIILENEKKVLEMQKVKNKISRRCSK